MTAADLATTGTRGSRHATQPAPPPEAAMTVAAIARRARVSSDLVRYYARIGLLDPARGRDNGYRLFTTADLRRLSFIRKAKELGYSLGEIRRILDHASHAESPCPEVREIIERRIDENREKLRELADLQARMERALAQWRAMPDGQPDGRTVCHLIEGFMDEEGG